MTAKNVDFEVDRPVTTLNIPVPPERCKDTKRRSSCNASSTLSPWRSSRGHDRRDRIVPTRGDVAL